MKASTLRSALKSEVVSASDRDAAAQPAMPERENWVVDFIEHTDTADFARLEKPDGEHVNVLLDLLPKGLKEGDVLSVRFGDTGFDAAVLPEATSTRQSQGQAKLDALNAAGTERTAQIAKQPQAAEQTRETDKEVEVIEL